MVAIGDVLQNRYDVIAVIKVGGMGAIYEVRDRRLGTRHALKEAFVTSREERAQFEHEARLLARLSHPALPRVSDHFSERGGQFLVMELVRGDDLETLLEQRGQPFAVELVLTWAEQVLAALEYLHSQQPPIIHRDIKPANLKPLAGGQIKLLDFGIAKASTHTIHAAKAFSLAYSPLEQFSAASHTDARSDIYALGATLYHLLTASAPPSAPERAQGTPLLSPGALNASCAPALAQIILRAMALQPQHRFADAAAMRAALQAVAASAQPHPSHRARWAAAAGASLTGVALLAGLGVVGMRAIGQPPASPPATAPPAAMVLLSSPTAVPISTPAPTSVPSPTAAPPTAAPSVTAQPPTAVVSTAVPATPLPTARQERDLTALTSASASSVLPSESLPTWGLVRYDPDNVLDRDLATSWVEGAAGSGIGEHLVLTFAQPVSITRLGLDVGFDRDERIFAANNRVRRVQVRFSDGSARSIEFQDQRGIQYASLPAITTNSLLITIETVYRGATYDDTAIAEVEVWGYQSP